MPNDIISKIKIGSTTYDINDSRVDSIADKIDSLSSAMILKGRSKQTLTDGGTQDPTKTSGTTMNNDAGDVWLQYGDEHQEYVWIVTDSTTSPATGHWELLGDEGSYVYKTYTHTFTPSGTVSTPSFTGTTATISATTSYQPAGTISQPTATAEEITLAHDAKLVTFNPTTGVEVDTGNPVLPRFTISGPEILAKSFTGTTATLSIAASYQPEGTISTPSFTGTTATITSTTSYQPEGTVSKPTFTGTTATLTSTASYQPAGTVSQPTFTGTSATITVTTNEAVTGVTAHTYQPEGTISTPSLTLSTTTFTSATITVNNEILSLPTTCLTGPSGAISYATGISAPTFTGTTATLNHGLTKATVTSTGNYQPAGTVSQPTFTGTTITISSTVKYQPAGGISQPTFTGITATITSTASYQPVGSISQPIFTGTTATIGSDIDYQPEGTITLALKTPILHLGKIGIVVPNHTFTPQVTVSTPTFTGTTVTITAVASYQPAGTISQPTFSGNTITLTHDTV